MYGDSSRFGARMGARRSVATLAVAAWLKPLAVSFKVLRRVLRGGLGALLCLGLLAGPPALAQTPADIEAAQRQAEILQRLEQERLLREQEEARRRADRVDGIDTRTLQPEIVVPDIGAVCREIAVITINGAPNLAPAVRQRISAEFAGRCLNVGDIERILAEITKSYIDRGFIATRAYLPRQDLGTGRLEILVIEGVVEKIMIRDDDAGSVSVANVFPGVEGGLLNLRDLEQGIDQINRLASNNARLDIQPGEQVGGSVVVVHNQPGSRFHFNVSVDNQGSRATGDVQTGATVVADNLLGFNDLVSFTHRESTPGDSDRKYSRSDNLNFSVPFGYTTLFVGVSRSRYASTIALPSGLELVASGKSENDNVRLDRVVYRDQSTRASLSAMLTSKRTENYLDGQRLGVSSRNLSVLDLDGSLYTGLAGGVVALELGYARGLDAFGALSDPGALPDWVPRAQFGKYKAGVNYARPFRLFGRDFGFSSQFTAQKAENTLYGSEQIFIGSLYSVRGFVGNTLAGDDGYYWRNEVSLRQPLALGDERIATRLYAGYDTGEVRNRVAGIPGGRLAGMVVGLSAQWRGASWDFFTTRPLTLPDSMTRESRQTWFRLAYTL